MTFWREFSTPPRALSRERERSVLTPNPMGSDFINTGGGNFGIIRGDVDSLSLQKTLLERMTYAGDGMGMGSFCDKEVA